MKIWTQDMLPLEIVQDLGLIYATDKSTTKARYMVFKCSCCSNTFRTEPSKVSSGKKSKCSTCSKPNLLNVVLGKKVCTTCKKSKDAEEFYNSKRTEDLLDSRCKVCADNYKQQWTEANPEIVANQISVKENARLLKRYGITTAEYNTLSDQQGHCCKICGNSASQGRARSRFLSVDHCHTTGTIRGLLCQKCNTGIGLLGDTHTSLLKALEYLEPHK